MVMMDKDNYTGLGVQGDGDDVTEHGTPHMTGSTGLTIKNTKNQQ